MTSYDKTKMTIKIIIAAMIYHAMIRPNQAMIILASDDKSPSRSANVCASNIEWR